MADAITPADGFFDPCFIPKARKLRDRHAAHKVRHARAAAGAVMAAARRGTTAAPRTPGRTAAGRPRGRRAGASSSTSSADPGEPDDEPPGLASTAPEHRRRRQAATAQPSPLRAAYPEAADLLRAIGCFWGRDGFFRWSNYPHVCFAACPACRSKPLRCEHLADGYPLMVEQLDTGGYRVHRLPGCSCPDEAIVAALEDTGYYAWGPAGERRWRGAA